MEKFITANIEEQAKTSALLSFRKVYGVDKKRNIARWLWGIFAAMLVILFLPWTQNIRAKGKVTTLRQEQRPQEMNTIIPGRIIKWYIKEGDYVSKGDTILQLGEVKMDYFDPELLNRTRQQIIAKEQSAESYLKKAATTEKQAGALAEGRGLKLQSLDNKIQQQQLKVSSDSADLVAIDNELFIYKRQIEAARLMLDSGVISLVDFEKRKVNFQTGLAKRTSAENKLLQSKQELINLRIEKNSAIQDYSEKISKTEGDKYSALSNAAATEAEVAKLRNLYANYDARNQLYYVLAPQDGQVIKAKKAGINEMLKEGEMIVEIVPTVIQYAVEMFVEPMDLPLISTGQKVRFVFDGFPAIVFSGWPSSSYGTFGGRVSAIETSVSTNGKFRVLVAEDPAERKWPQQLKMGSGANGISLLKNVSIYYEIWRNINGFPPEYYSPENNGGKKIE
ncbi:HlyD family secretion protein [Flavihumibacter profundi]|uniref:HlyD family secretion protein n=1 Tax=Flavihumibacter profundi TaxID=2716883 RepID=UPI001CC799BA|nr:HlyD family efflux transporter periplasmic adaptor subunit [Flavihumibacter profundi]MBZ5855475.1 HlyD family secretion protein [Flavihumibacter profundi]